MQYNFIAYVNHTDGGCDYTIACGKILWEIEGNNTEEALTNLRAQVLGEFCEDECFYTDSYRGEMELEDIALYEVINKIEVPLTK